MLTVSEEGCDFWEMTRELTGAAVVPDKPNIQSWFYDYVLLRS